VQRRTFEGFLRGVAAACRGLLRGGSAAAERQKKKGDVMRVQGRHEDAVRCYEKAIRIRPHYADAHNNLGAVLGALGHKARAMECFRAALVCEPGLAEAHINLGNALQEQGQLDAALAAYGEALRVEPDHALAYNNLAALYQDLGRIEEARECDERVLRIRPNDGTRIKRAIRMPVVTKSRQDIARIRDDLHSELTDLLEAGVRLEDPLAEVGQTTFLLPYHGLNDKNLHCLLATLYARACPALNYVAPHCSAPRPAGARRRVGFLSRYFFNHSVGTWFSRLIDRLAADGAIEAVVITVGYENAANLRATFPSLRAHLAIPFHLDRAREEISALELDVLVYADIGMDPLGYFLAFSRLAPVQCAMLGHPVTSGIPNVDYFISSALFEPEDADAHYSEALVRLDALPAYIARPALPAEPKDRAAFGLPEHRRIYACPTMLQKLHPDFDCAIAQILRRDPDGEVVLFQDSRFPHWHRMVLDRFAVTIPDVLDRVRFLPWLSSGDLMSVLLTADVALDTFHFGAATTTFLILATGTPIVTLPAEFARGRASLGCYRRIGVMDCIASSAEEYSDLAVRIATDRSVRDSIKARILEGSGALYDDPQLVAEMTRVLSTLEPRQPRRTSSSSA